LGKRLHILADNAGIVGGPLVRDTRGYEAQFATNHLGHFQLRLGLLPALRAAAGARVVELSSAGHQLSDIRWDDPHFNVDYDGMLAYGQDRQRPVRRGPRSQMVRRRNPGLLAAPGPDRRHQSGAIAG
jgi:NAD(P)-dependent dehydrogenase (short-subunit alcohol dehydrogenase family)